MVKKQIIMDNALELFAKQGFEATSVQQITEKCGISKGAFYLSFKSKDELISSLLDQFLEDLLQNYEQAVNTHHNDDNLLYEYCLLSFKNVEKNMAFAHLFMQEASSMLNKTIFERLQSFQFIVLRTLQTIVERQFPTLDKLLQNEIVFTVNALVKSHTEYMVLHNEIGSLELISRSIEEKISILATNISLTAAPQQQEQFIVLPLERLIDLIEEKLNNVEDVVAKESLQLLYMHLTDQPLSPAIESGIMHNLHANTSLKYIAYMYELYQSSL